MKVILLSCFEMFLVKMNQTQYETCNSQCCAQSKCVDTPFIWIIFLNQGYLVTKINVDPFFLKMTPFLSFFAAINSKTKGNLLPMLGSLEWVDFQKKTFSLKQPLYNYSKNLFNMITIKSTRFNFHSVLYCGVAIKLYYI